MEDLYTKIFINTDLALEELIDLLREITGGKKTGRSSVVSEDFDIDVCENDDHGSGLAEEFGTEENKFLFFPFFFEIEPATSNIEKRRFVACLDKFLDKLLGMNVQFAVACDFEEDLKIINNFT